MVVSGGCLRCLVFVGWLLWLFMMAGGWLFRWLAGWVVCWLVCLVFAAGVWWVWLIWFILWFCAVWMRDCCDLGGVYVVYGVLVVGDLRAGCALMIVGV